MWKKISLDKKWATFSNVLTILRLLLTPVVVSCLYYQKWLEAFWVFVFAASTDLLDGHLARLFDEQTHLGAFLDPIADKFLILSSFGALAFFHSPFFHIPWWFFIIVFSRDLVTLIGSCLLLCFYKDAHLEPMMWGKLNTLLQVLFLVWVFVCYFAGWEPYRTYLAILVILAIFSLFSLLQYIQRALFDVRSSMQKLELK
jgi:cardiolipin synthase